MFVGISGIELVHDRVDLGNDIVLARTSARLTTQMVLSFGCKPYGERAELPIEMANTQCIDIQAELQFPQNFAHKSETYFGVSRLIISLLRMWRNPGSRLAAISRTSFAALIDLPVPDIKVLPVETRPHNMLFAKFDSEFGEDVIEAVAKHWETFARLASTDRDFKLAVEAVEAVQYVPSSAMRLVLMWGALEALFSPSVSELRFRVSSLLAAYLYDYGSGRQTAQKAIAKLYDLRSAAAHGVPKHQDADVVQTYSLLCRALTKMILEKRVPDSAELDARLFGGSA